MKVHRGIDALNPELFRAPVATIGVFDGIHLGHRAVFEATRELAREVDGESVVVTFDNHPRGVVSGKVPRMLTSVPHRLVLLRRLGMDHAVLLPFDEELRETPAEVFADRVFAEGIGVRGIVLGFDSRFGKDRAGDEALLKTWSEGKDVRIRSAPPVLVDGRPISSSVIRAAIAEGEYDRAQAMLGRPVAVYGEVVPGSGRGADLGFATANLDVGGELCPPNGVYAAWSCCMGRWHPSLVNIGTRPTFDGEDAPVHVEVHIPGVESELYGLEIEVQFIRFLRDEMKFADADALIAQIRKDREELDRIVADVHAPPEPLP
jgi:riboflavin kinase/FMN adenylyltransferase